VTCCAFGLAGTVLLAFLAGAVFRADARSGVKLERPHCGSARQGAGEDERA
jgi:hypothetical protein